MGVGSPIPAVVEPRKGGWVLDWCLKAREDMKRNRVIAGNGITAQRTENGTMLSVKNIKIIPTAFTQKGQGYIDASTPYVDIYDGYVFWNSRAFGLAPLTVGSYTSVELADGTNHVYVNLDWNQAAPVITYDKLATGTPTPSASNFRVHLATYEVSLSEGRVTQTFIAHRGGNIYTPENLPHPFKVSLDGVNISVQAGKLRVFNDSVPFATVADFAHSSQTYVRIQLTYNKATQSYSYEALITAASEVADTMTDVYYTIASINYSTGVVNQIASGDIYDKRLTGYDVTGAVLQRSASEWAVNECIDLVVP